jgi:hypothetical protein
MTVAFRESLGSGPPQRDDDLRCPQSTNAHEAAGDGSEDPAVAVGVHGSWGRINSRQRSRLLGPLFHACMSLLWCVGLLVMAVRFVDVSDFLAWIGSLCLRHCVHGDSIPVTADPLPVRAADADAVSALSAPLSLASGALRDRGSGEQSSGSAQRTHLPTDPTDKNAPHRKRFAQVFELVWVLLLDGWSGALKQPSGHDRHGSNSSSSGSSSKGSSSLYTRGHSLHGVLFVACVLLLFVKYHHRTYPSRICLPQSRNDC